VKEAAQVLLIMAILERLHVTKSVSWLEDVRAPRRQLRVCCVRRMRGVLTWRADASLCAHVSTWTT
jgi:hypothetical protein